MKKIYLLGILIASFQLLTAQSSLIVIDVNNGQALVALNSHLSYTASSGQQISTEIDAKNTSSTTQYYKLKRFDDVLNSGASAYFCVGGSNCYTPATTISPVTVTLTPGQTLSSQSLSLLLDFEEGSVSGYSSIRYQIFNINDANDVFTFSIRYNDNGTSIKDSFTAFSALSGVFPNPSTGKAFINLNSNFEGGTLSLMITNTLGAVVHTKAITLSAGKNTLALELENLTSGLYFVTLSTGNTVITRKFTINK